MKRRKVTEDEWREIARHAYFVRENIMQLISLISGAVSTKTLDRGIKLEYTLDAIRSELEDEMFRSGGSRDVNIFYPGSMSSQEFMEAGIASQKRRVKQR